MRVYFVCVRVSKIPGFHEYSFAHPSYIVDCIVCISWNGISNVADEGFVEWNGMSRWMFATITGALSRLVKYRHPLPTSSRSLISARTSKKSLYRGAEKQRPGHIFPREPQRKSEWKTDEVVSSPIAFVLNPCQPSPFTTALQTPWQKIGMLHLFPVFVSKHGRVVQKTTMQQKNASRWTVENRIEWFLTS